MLECIGILDGDFLLDCIIQERATPLLNVAKAKGCNKHIKVHQIVA